MKPPKTGIFNGETHEVPQCIQRIDHRATHGWQLRYGGTRLFSDGELGSALSLQKATRELLKRIAVLPAPSTLQREPSQNKSSDLPVGISGPVVRQRAKSLVRDTPSLMRRVVAIHDELDDAALAEEFVEGREFYVGVIGNDEPQPLPPIELDFSGMPEGMGHVVDRAGK